MAISAAKARFLEETRNREHGQRIRDLRSEHHREYRNEVKKNKIQIQEIKDIYEGQVGRLEMELEGKLAQIRDRHKKTLEKEKVRLEKELDTLQGSFEKKREELAIGQQEEFERMQRSHRKILQNAENKVLSKKHRAGLAGS